MKRSSKLALEDVKVQSFVTLLHNVEYHKLKGGSSMGTIQDHETCDDMYHKPFHYNEGYVDP